MVYFIKWLPLFFSFLFIITLYSCYTPDYFSSRTDALITSTMSSYRPSSEESLVYVQLIEANSLSNTQVELVFNAILTLESASNIDYFNLGALDVLEATLSDEEPTKVLLTTEPQTDIEYTVEVGQVVDVAGNKISVLFNSKTFTGSLPPLDIQCPSLLRAEALDTTSVRIYFSEPMNLETITDKIYYQIPNLFIQEVFVDASATQAIIWTTEQLPIEYTVSTTEGEDLANNRICEGATATFMGSLVADDVPPSLVSIDADDRYSIHLVFSEPVDPATSQDVYNYAISNLTILSATLIDHASKEILLSTNQQEGTTSYTVTINNILDLSGNSIGTDVAGTFTSKPKSTKNVPPVLLRAGSISNTKILVQFSQAMDPADAETLYYYNNYKLTFSSVNQDDLNTSRVELTTSSQSQSAYTLTVNSIKGSNGELILPNSQVTFMGDGKPCVDTVSVLNQNQVILSFIEPLDMTSALVLENYTEIDQGLPIQQVLFDPNHPSQVMLITDPQTASVNYTLEITQVKDQHGNKIETNYPPCYRIAFIGANTGDITPATIESITAVGSTAVQITFSELMDSTSVQNIGFYTLTPPLTITQIALDANHPSRYILTTDPMINTTYSLTINGVMDLANNVSNSAASFEGDEVPKLDTIESIGSKEIQVTFTESVDVLSAENTSNYTINDITVEQAKRDETDLSLVHLTTSTQNDGITYTLTVNQVRDLTRNVVADPNNTATFIGDGIPKAVEAKVLSNRDIEVTYSEPMEPYSVSNAARYSIPDLAIHSVSLVAEDPTKVRIHTNPMTDAVSYTITAAGVKDLKMNPVEEPYNAVSFVGVDGTLYSTQNLGREHHSILRWDHAHTVQGYEANEAEFQSTGALFTSISVDTELDILYAINASDTSIAVWENASQYTNEAVTRTITSSSFDENLSDILVDSNNDRLYVSEYSESLGQATIMVFDEASLLDGEQDPVRTFSYEAFQGAFGMALDPTTDTIYVSETLSSTISVWDNASTVDGIALPDRQITSILSPSGIGVDPDRDILWVAAIQDANNPHRIAIFDNAGSVNGATMPSRVIQGDKTLLSYPIDLVIDPINDRLIAASLFNHHLLIWDHASEIAGNIHAHRTIEMDAPIGLALDITR